MLTSYSGGERDKVFLLFRRRSDQVILNGWLCFLSNNLIMLFKPLKLLESLRYVCFIVARF